MNQQQSQGQGNQSQHQGVPDQKPNGGQQVAQDDQDGAIPGSDQDTGVNKNAQQEQSDFDRHPRDESRTGSDDERI